MSAHVPPRPASAASQRTIQVRVNGERRELPAGLSLAELLEVLGVPAAGTAVELGGTIVPPARHPVQPRRTCYFPDKGRLRLS